MDKFIQLTLSGSADGAILALVALGFVLIFKSSDVINFAQGELLMLGAYLTYATIGQLGLAWPIGVVLAVALAAGGGSADRAARAATADRRAGDFGDYGHDRPLGAATRAHRRDLGHRAAGRARVHPRGTDAYPGRLDRRQQAMGHRHLDRAVRLLTLFFRRSNEGIAMRAVADDQQAALSVGISVKHTWAVAWAIAAISAAIGGILLASIFGGVGADIGPSGCWSFRWSSWAGSTVFPARSSAG